MSPMAPLPLGKRRIVFFDGAVAERKMTETAGVREVVAYAGETTVVTAVVEEIVMRNKGERIVVRMPEIPQGGKVVDGEGLRRVERSRRSAGYPPHG